MNYGFIGYGELGRQVESMLRGARPVAQTCYFDDICVKQGVPGSYPFASYIEERFGDVACFVCLGYKHLIKKLEIVQHLRVLGRQRPGFVHPTAFVNPTASVGAGAVLYPLCNIDKEVELGEGVLLNNSVVVSHNSRVGDGCYLSPGVVVSGFVTMGRNCFVGSGAVISNNLSIGNNVQIALGTVVTRDLPDNVSAIGNPMRMLNRPLRLT